LIFSEIAKPKGRELVTADAADIADKARECDGRKFRTTDSNRKLIGSLRLLTNKRVATYLPSNHAIVTVAEQYDGFWPKADHGV
jgi:hypothetical protein